MNTRFDALLASVGRDKKRLNQLVPEWRAFLDYCQGYFLARGIVNPIVVEIGILDGAQRRFYEWLLNAEYIGIDIDKKSPATIIGNSASQAALSKLKDLLQGRKIDLLFIDGLHTYEGVKSDYDMYGPLTKHIIAIHDIHTPKSCPEDTANVIPFWQELLRDNKQDTLITIQHYNPKTEGFNGRALGIGLVVKG